MGSMQGNGHINPLQGCKGAFTLPWQIASYGTIEESTLAEKVKGCKLLVDITVVISINVVTMSGKKDSCHFSSNPNPKI